jgi:hypothetical protein
VKAVNAARFDLSARRLVLQNDSCREAFVDESATLKFEFQARLGQSARLLGLFVWILAFRFEVRGQMGKMKAVFSF